jgi:hypothetical protein
MCPAKKQNPFLAARAIPRENSGVRSAVVIKVTHLKKGIEAKP